MTKRKPLPKIKPCPWCGGEGRVNPSLLGPNGGSEGTHYFEFEEFQDWWREREECGAKESPRQRAEGSQEAT